MLFQKSSTSILTTTTLSSLIPVNEAIFLISETALTARGSSIEGLIKTIDSTSLKPFQTILPPLFHLSGKPYKIIVSITNYVLTYRICFSMWL